MSKDVLLISVQTVKDKSPVHKNMDDTLIFPEIKIAQDQSIVSAIGSCLMERLQEGITNGDLTADEDILLNEYITDALVQFVLAGLPLTTAFQFFTKGPLSRLNENSTGPSVSDMVDISAQYTHRAKFYRDRLVTYLRNNKDLYPLYDGCGCDDDIRPEKSGYSAPMWLGGDDDCDC